MTFSSRFPRRTCSRRVGIRWFRGRGGRFRPGTDAFRPGSTPFRAGRCRFRPGTRAFRPGTGRFRAGCGIISSGRRRFQGGTRGGRRFWSVVASQLRAGIDVGWDGVAGTRRRPPLGLGGQEHSCRGRVKCRSRAENISEGRSVIPIPNLGGCLTQAPTAGCGFDTYTHALQTLSLGVT